MMTRRLLWSAPTIKWFLPTFQLLVCMFFPRHLGLVPDNISICLSVLSETGMLEILTKLRCLVSSDAGLILLILTNQTPLINHIAMNMNFALRIWKQNMHNWNSVLQAYSMPSLVSCHFKSVQTLKCSRCMCFLHECWVIVFHKESLHMKWLQGTAVLSSSSASDRWGQMSVWAVQFSLLWLFIKYFL